MICTLVIALRRIQSVGSVLDLLSNTSGLKMSIRAVLFDLDNTLTHRGRSVSALSQSLVDTYRSQLNFVDVEQIESIVNRIDNGGYPLKKVFNPL